MELETASAARREPFSEKPGKSIVSGVISIVSGIV